MQNLLLSILIPVYNIERYIGLCLESVIKQTYNNLEIIVVDDGSTDRSGEICDLYARKDSRIKVIHKENGGLVSARKAAMCVATGDVIGYVDGDDYVDEDFFEIMISNMVKEHADCVISGYWRDIFGKSVQMSNYLQPKVYQGKDIEYFFSNMISTGEFFNHGITTYLWNKIFKKEIIYQSQMDVDDRITIGEDGAVVYPALLNCQTICVIEEPRYHYRQREDSMLKKTDNYKSEAEQLTILYYSLLKSCADKPSRYNLQHQIEEYVLSTFIIRSGGIGNDIIPLIQDKKIAVYGAGTFGQQLVRRLKLLNMCELATWVDEDYWEYRRCCIDVDDEQTLMTTDFDYILIGMISAKAIRRTKEKLIEMGFDKTKILGVTDFVNTHHKSLGNYLTF